MLRNSSDDEYRAIWLAGEETGRREERARIIDLLESKMCDKVFCKEAKIMRTHSSCNAILEYIELIRRDTHE